jgi:putative endonuclease
MPLNRRYYCVYIIGNATRILYTGITSNLHKRVWLHKNKLIDGYTSNFHVCRLVYFESFDDVRKAIDREKQIKRWRREKKIKLIESMNPNWHDLSDGWYERPKATAKALPLDSRGKRARSG